jgi:hypothetical protein
LADDTLINGFDTRDWTPEQRAELRTLLNEEKIAAQTIADVAKEAASPASILADKRVAAEQAKQDATDLRAFQDAKKKYGESNIGTIETRDGLIIMRTATAEECDRREERYRGLADSDRAAADYAWFDETKVAIVHPSSARVDDMCKRFPRLQNQVEQMYTGLVNGLRVRALGK